MKRLLLILILTFSFETLAKADDITDFQVEGISIGDSLLDIATVNQINKAKSKKQLKNSNFYRFDLERLKDLEIYDWARVTIKKDDNSYTVINIGAAIDYAELDECKKIKKDVQNGVEQIFTAIDKEETTFASPQDETGKSIIYGVQYYTKPYPSNEAIVVNCYHMTEESNIKRSVIISVNSEEFAEYLVSLNN
jgi:hypothetical protein